MMEKSDGSVTSFNHSLTGFCLLHPPLSPSTVLFLLSYSTTNKDNPQTYLVFHRQLCVLARFV